jgi:hypothetical protein
MKITGTKCYIDVEHNGKTARFGGELGIDGFYAIYDTLRWLLPKENVSVTDDERNKLIKAVIADRKGKEVQIFFIDRKGEMIDIQRHEYQS